MSIGVRGMHGGNEPGYIPLTTAGFILDEAIAYPIVIGATAPSFGWFYGGFALFMYVVDTWNNIFS
jgi:hypothetical protein